MSNFGVNSIGRTSMKLKCSKVSLWLGLVILCSAIYISIFVLHLTTTTASRSDRFKGVVDNYVRPGRIISDLKALVPNVMWDEPPTQWTKSPVKWVAIVSYQRCGSSFFGNLFNFDPDAFYVYEPLDGLYTSMYGTVPGWNVPSDIVSYKNGSQREIPKHERRAVAGFLQNLFECEITSLPTLSLTSPLWSMRFQRKLRYWPCVLKFIKNRHGYRRFLQLGCPSRFDASTPALDRCRQFLNDSSVLIKSANNSATGRMKNLVENVSKYFSSLQEMRRSLETGNCSQILRNRCVDSRVRVVKLVRGTMKSMRLLLETHPHLYVIHLVRDPRAVALSRMRFHASGRGLYSTRARTWSDKLSREAAIYCRQVVNDVTVRRQLELQFPERLLAVNYEQVVDDPVGNAEKIYRFLGLTVPEVVVQKFSELTLFGNRNLTGKSLATSWEEKLNASVRVTIDDLCVEMLNLYPQYNKIK